MADLNREKLLEMYRQMVFIRRFEERCKELFGQRKIGGVYLHLYNGQEGTGVGALAALRPTDHVITAYRDHGIAISKGADPKRRMAEMFGKRTGVSGGKGGSMHLADRSKQMWGGYGIVGAHLSIAAGIGLKIKYNNEDSVLMCFIGDGATNNGYFHESLNLSAVWKLPIVWIIENNLYGMGTPIELSSGQTQLHQRAIAYGMEDGGRIDGMDVLAVYEAAKKAVEYARASGPILLESLTYRFEGHGMSDKVFQDRVEELRQYHEKDPIARMQSYLLEKYKSITSELEHIQQTAYKEVEDAVEYADASPVPTAEDLLSNLYVD